MDAAFRDLDRIQECDDSDARSRLLMTSIAALLAFAVIVVVAMVSTQTRSHASDLDRDPMDGLAKDHPLRHLASAEADQVNVDKTRLSFHSVLRDDVDREIEAALRSAHASESVGEADPSPVHASTTGAAVDFSPQAAASRFGLQVIAYETDAPAEAFAATLRQRGHPAYVVRSQQPGRGTYWRVRVGPFDARADAEDYRQRFEEQEQMNAIVVQQRQPVQVQGMQARTLQGIDP